MPLNLKQAQTPKCPAAEIQQPVFSPHDIDLECRISGQLMPVGLRPCNGCYAECNTWKNAAKQRILDTSMKTARALENNRAKHTLSSTDREKIRA